MVYATVGGVSGVLALSAILMWSAEMAHARPSLLSRFGSADTTEGLRVRRSPGGFRAGAADRFSHGFGKRSSLEDLLAPPEQAQDDVLMSDEILVSAIRTNPVVADLFVRQYVDVNGDGFVSQSELQQLVSD